MDFKIDGLLKIDILFLELGRVTGCENVAYFCETTVIG
jgi:hypothetical protein